MGWHEVGINTVGHRPTCDYRLSTCSGPLRTGSSSYSHIKLDFIITICSSTFYVYCDVPSSHTHIINWLNWAPCSTLYQYTKHYMWNLCVQNYRIISRPWKMEIVSISSQMAATGKCAIPTTHLILQFSTLAESKTIIPLLVLTQLWFPVFVWKNSTWFISMKRATVCSYDEAPSTRLHGCDCHARKNYLYRCMKSVSAWNDSWKTPWCEISSGKAHAGPSKLTLFKVTSNVLWVCDRSADYKLIQYSAHLLLQ